MSVPAKVQGPADVLDWGTHPYETAGLYYLWALLTMPLPTCQRLILCPLTMRLAMCQRRIQYPFTMPLPMRQRLIQ